jgi:hypothetical protein
VAVSTAVRGGETNRSREVSAALIQLDLLSRVITMIFYMMIIIQLNACASPLSAGMLAPFP